MDILLRSQRPLRRFAGVREHRLVEDPRAVDPDPDEKGWEGFDSLVYLADARIVAGGATGMHEHQEIDIITLVVEGRVVHQGSLHDGVILQPQLLMVQRGGAEGFSHNEANPDDTPNRIIQLWLLPEKFGEASEYRLYQIESGAVTRVYGGSDDQQETLSSSTRVDIARLPSGQSIDIDTGYLAYLVTGAGSADEESVSEGTLFRGQQLSFDATEDCVLIIVHRAPG